MSTRNYCISLLPWSKLGLLVCYYPQLWPQLWQVYQLDLEVKTVHTEYLQKKAAAVRQEKLWELFCKFDVANFGIIPSSQLLAVDDLALDDALKRALIESMEKDIHGGVAVKEFVQCMDECLPGDEEMFDSILECYASAADSFLPAEPRVDHTRLRGQQTSTQSGVRHAKLCELFCVLDNAHTGTVKALDMKALSAACAAQDSEGDTEGWWSETRSTELMQKLASVSEHGLQLSDFVLCLDEFLPSDEMSFDCVLASLNRAICEQRDPSSRLQLSYKAGLSSQDVHSPVVVAPMHVGSVKVHLGSGSSAQQDGVILRASDENRRKEEKEMAMRAKEEAEKRHDEEERKMRALPKENADELTRTERNIEIEKARMQRDIQDMMLKVEEEVEEEEEKLRKQRKEEEKHKLQNRLQRKMEAVLNMQDTEQLLEDSEKLRRLQRAKEEGVEKLQREMQEGVERIKEEEKRLQEMEAEAQRERNETKRGNEMVQRETEEAKLKIEREREAAQSELYHDLHRVDKFAVKLLKKTYQFGRRAFKRYV